MGKNPRPVSTGSWPGCHVLDAHSKWIQGVEPFSSESFGVPESQVPDNIIDPVDGLLCVVNKHHHDAKIFTITVRGKKLIAEGGRKLAPGTIRDGDVSRSDVTTLIIRVEPRQLIEVCHVRPLPTEDIDLSSDIQAWQSVQETPEAVEVGFPLEGGPYLCSQGAGGLLTHCVHQSTYFAVDFDCPVGTPVLAIADGEVCDVKDEESCSGIDCSFLFRWNQISVRHYDGTISEYVHISQHSARVKVGNTVQRGDVMCASGDIGFSPKPHLHLQVTRASDGISLPMKFSAPNGPFSVVEGVHYTASGPA
eukprot:GEMP01084391.1.p1 GENE.GEMP01084391.1~~GEMP01084391.1.p1  ORF type:complete len:316 (+),score=66.77 GEMP01084391.1:29-949(+)